MKDRRLTLPTRLVPQAFQESRWAMSVLVLVIVATGWALISLVIRALQRQGA